MTQHSLQLHPRLTCRAADAISVEIQRSPAGLLSFVYTVTGDIDRLKLSPPVAPDRTDNLWKTTCFEAFVRPGDAPDYLEFNFSPSTAWAAYAFTGEREGMRDLDLPAVPRIQATREDGTYRVEVLLDLSVVEAASNPVWHVGLTAVIEDVDGALAYWALDHVSPPNFHNRDTWVCELKTSEQA